MTAGAKILQAFYRAENGFVSTEEAGSEVEELRQLGYVIEAHPHFGYRMVSAPDRLTADEVLARLKPQLIGREVVVFQETASTNDVAQRTGVEGLVVFAEEQTQGRGRQGRRWVAAKEKGILFSVLLRPDWPREAMSRLTVAASVAVARAVGGKIKWPNDVMLNERKVAGILTEVRKGAAILGVGINVNQEQTDFPSELRTVATSLLVESGEKQNRAALAAVVLAELNGLYELAQRDFAMVSAEWAGLSTTLGKQIAVGTVEGVAQALDESGALLVRCESGRIERVVGGDVVER